MNSQNQLQSGPDDLQRPKRPEVASRPARFLRVGRGLWGGGGGAEGGAGIEVVTGLFKRRRPPDSSARSCVRPVFVAAPRRRKDQERLRPFFQPPPRAEL